MNENPVKPIPIDTAFGDPDAEARAEAELGRVPVCADEQAHCACADADTGACTKEKCIADE